MSAVLETREPSAWYPAEFLPARLREFDLVSTAPGGVARLRELILLLAVRGELAPHDPVDQSAQETLKQIQVQRERLIGTGLVKVPKSRNWVGNEDPPFEIPPNWEWATLSEIVRVLNGRAYSKQELLDAGPTPVLRVGNLFTSDHWYYSNLSLEPDKLCKPGDLLFAWSASFGPFIWDGPNAIFHYHIWKLDPIAPELFNVQYLHLFLREKTAELKAAGHGVSMVHLTKEKMEKIPVPWPPLAEQARIVACVDELMQLCDALEAKGRLEAQQHARLLETLLGTLTDSTTPEELAANWQRVAEHSDLLLDRPEAVDVLEQTVLQLAVRGLLVPQDRNDIPPARLISTGPGRSPVPPHSTIPPDQSESNVETGLLPSGWELVQLHQVADTRLGKMLDKSKNRGLPRPYLRNTNVQWGRFDLGDVKTMNLEESELQEFRLAVGDLLICEGGEPGRCAIWRDDEREMYFQKALHRVRPHAGVSAEYIAIALESDAISGALDEYFTGATIKHFVGQALQRYTFALPPAAEQARIVARVTELRRLCAELRHCLAASQATQSRLAGALVESVETT